MGKSNCNSEGCQDSTVLAAIGNENRLEWMCQSCMHRSYCGAAFKKDHWCGNHKGGSYR
ncbi:MAG: hypothetical protein PHW47_00285 [Lachnospira sp.]|nr:hypothetical protein [Lachnospira sp.]